MKYRQSLIEPAWEDELYKYITGIVQNHKHKMIGINGMPDHFHIFIGFHTTQSIAELIKSCEGGFGGVDQWEAIYKGAFQVAGGIWCVYVQPQSY